MERMRRRFTVYEYHRMGEAGILHEDDRVELIEGELVDMTPIGGRHAACVRELNRLLVKRVGDEMRVDVQNPIRLGEHSEPQPDLAVIRAHKYGESLPGAEDALLLIEVSDTTLSYDRNVKLPLYARAGIREAWVVNLHGGTIERHTYPSENGYRSVVNARPGEKMESVALPDLTLAVDDVFA